MKQTGILLPVTALPGEMGVGEFGTKAYEWLDILEENHITIWQILPLNPTGYGNSPYQPYSSFAGDEIYISLGELQKEGLLKESPLAFGKGEEKVLYDEVRAYKETYLREAFAQFEETGEYQEFVAQDWVEQYSVFRAFRKANDGACWTEWQQEQKNWPENQNIDLSEYAEEIAYQKFLQYQFFKQWMAVKNYASDKNIKIMGDVPFYVGLDSADVWAGKKNFLLGADGKPTFIAGVPPDYFSATGQRWGNPIYDWEQLEKDKFAFWVNRIGYSQKLFDIIRIDHFRAFDTYWKIPSSCPTAVEGEWLEAPGYNVIDTLLEEIPGLSLVAEDLGDLRPEVHVLKEHYHLKGMKVVEFAIDVNRKMAVDQMADIENVIVYTGTHDNATVKEWYEDLSVAQRRKVRRFLTRKGFKQGTVEERFIAYTLSAKAEYAIIPMADFLQKGRDARMNTPGTVGSPNWEWRMKDLESAKKALKKFEKMLER